MDQDMFRTHMEEAGLARYTDAILALARNSIRIKHTVASDDEIEAGESKIGGCPDLPPDVEWPWYDYNKSLLFPPEQRTVPPRLIPTPLSFVAQINLADVSELDINKLLPSTGMLYFFCDAVNQPINEDPNGHKVMYYDGDTADLTRTDFPEELDEIARFTPLQLKFVSETTLPRYDSIFLDRLGMLFSEQDRYNDIRSELVEESCCQLEEQHRMLGHPDHEQGDVFMEAEVLSTGRPVDDYSNPEVIEAATGWELLLQVDSVTDPGMDQEIMWGDQGNIFFCIRRSDLESRNFDNTWRVDQCG